MHKERIKKWIDALRSGKYDQGQGQLAYNEGDDLKYCCLGVACEVAIQEGVKLTKFVNEYGEIDYVSDNVYESTLLPTAVKDWLGLDNPNPTLVGHSASFWNDEGAKDFNEIADLIEKTYVLEGEADERPPAST